MTETGHIEDPWASRRARVVRILAAIGMVAVIGTAFFADYLSSWLPKIGGFPAGAILRDAVAMSFVALAVAVLFRGRSGRIRASLASGGSGAVARLAAVPFAAFAVWVLVLLLPSPAMVPAILTARNLVVYVMVGFAAYILITRRVVSVSVLLGTLTVFGFIAAGLGILDTATGGGIVTSLGYSRDYAGVEGSENRLISGTFAAFQGYVRASGGISNSLVFGYLMAAIAVFAVWMLDRAVTRSGWRTWATVVYLALGTLAGIACIESLTRGALIALALGLVTLVVMRRSRPIVVGAVSTVAMAFFLILANTGGVSTPPPGEATVPGQAPAPSQAAVPSPTEDPGLLGAVGTRVTSSDPVSQESSSLRLEQLRLALESLAARPMGNGLGTEGSASTREATPGVNLAPDVFVLIVALQTGVVGVALYGLIFAVMVLWALRRPTKGRELVVAMIGIFGISAVLSASPDAPVFATTIWILILAVSAVAVLDDQGARPSTARP